VAAVRANAEHRAANLRIIVDDLRSQGFTSVRAIAAQLNERGILAARGIQRQPLGSCRGCEPAIDKEPPMVARFARNAPGTWFQKYRVKLRGCRGNGATEVSSGKPVLISGRNKSSWWATENNQLANGFAN
jgi:hypothetical protein